MAKKVETEEELLYEMGRVLLKGIQDNYCQTDQGSVSIPCKDLVKDEMAK